jgi:undecaprenyl diphosphate synthase
MNYELKHIAIIPDGNGRWAKEQGKDRLFGHAQGSSAVLKAIEAADELKIPFISFYAFSTENFKRDKSEVLGIFSLITEFLEKKLLPLIKQKNYKIRFIGEFNALPQEFLSTVGKINKVGLNNSGMTITFAVGYGGIDEVLGAFNVLLKTKFALGDNSPLVYEDLERCLYTAHLPNPCVVARYGGLKRLSNFMPLQTTYSELMFFDKLWPDFEKEDLADIVEKFNLIPRKFGDAL